MESVAILMPVHDEAESIEETLGEIATKIFGKYENAELWRKATTVLARRKCVSVLSKRVGRRLTDR